MCIRDSNTINHRSVCVPRTEAPGRHRTQTRTQASPAVAESEARLAIGFLVVDNSGPAAADSDFAASVVRQLRRPIRQCSRQMSRWITTTKSRRTPPQCSHIAKERFAGWCILGFNTTAPAVGLSRVSPQNDKNYVTYSIISYGSTYTLVSWLHEPEKKKEKATTRTRTCSYSSQNITQT